MIFMTRCHFLGSIFSIVPFANTIFRKRCWPRYLWEKAHAPPDRGPPQKEITFDSSYS